MLVFIFYPISVISSCLLHLSPIISLPSPISQVSGRHMFTHTSDISDGVISSSYFPVSEGLPLSLVFAPSLLFSSSICRHVIFHGVQWWFTIFVFAKFFFLISPLIFWIIFGNLSHVFSSFANQQISLFFCSICFSFQYSIFTYFGISTLLIKYCWYLIGILYPISIFRNINIRYYDYIWIDRIS